MRSMPSTSVSSSMSRPCSVAQALPSEAEFNLGMFADLPEIVAYRELAKQHKIKQIAAEYIVTDHNSIATCIDNVAYVNGELALLDYKTTSVLNIEYLRWQLSLESLMFTMVNQCSVAKAYAVHLPKPKDGICEAKLVEIELIPCNHLMSLLNAFNAGADTFDNPLRNMGNDFESILEQYIQAEQALLDIRGIVAEYEKTQAAHGAGGFYVRHFFAAWHATGAGKKAGHGQCLYPDGFI